MRHLHPRTILATLTALVLVPALAQETATVADFEPVGQIEHSYEAHDQTDRGAIILTHTTPGDQHANFDVVGPDDYWNHFDFSDEPDAEHVLDDLLPGVYSIAATDEGLSLVHTVVEVRAGEAVRVHADLEAWEEGAAVPGAYDPYAAYGVRNRAAYPGYPGYPYGAAQVAEPVPYSAQPGFGAIMIDARDETIDTIVTGPNGYYVELEGDGVTDPLWPGVYAVASTESGYDLAVTTVEVQEEQQIEVALTLVQIEGASGGQDGAGQQEDAQDDQQEGEGSNQD